MVTPILIFILFCKFKIVKKERRKKMAGFLDKTFEELMEQAPRVIREGFTGTRTIVYPDPEKPDKGLIVELNSVGKVIGAWPIKKGRAYRITPQKVISLPLIEQDPDPIRRFCRKNGIALTKIVRCERGEKICFGPPRCQGETGYRSIGINDPPVVFERCWTTGNPEWVFNILVVRGEEPKTYEQFCTIAQNWESVISGQYVL